MKKKKMKKVKISDWMLEKEKPGDAINVLNQSVFNLISSIGRLALGSELGSSRRQCPLLGKRKTAKVSV